MSIIRLLGIVLKAFNQAAAPVAADIRKKYEGSTTVRLGLVPLDPSPEVGLIPQCMGCSEPLFADDRSQLSGLCYVCRLALSMTAEAGDA